MAERPTLHIKPENFSFRLWQFYTKSNDYGEFYQFIRGKPCKYASMIPQRYHLKETDNA